MSIWHSNSCPNVYFQSDCFKVITLTGANHRDQQSAPLFLIDLILGFCSNHSVKSIWCQSVCSACLQSCACKFLRRLERRCDRCREVRSLNLAFSPLFLLCFNPTIFCLFLSGLQRFTRIWRKAQAGSGRCCRVRKANRFSFTSGLGKPTSYCLWGRAQS